MRHISRKLQASAAAAEMLLTTNDTKDHERDQTSSVPPSCSRVCTERSRSVPFV